MIVAGIREVWAKTLGHDGLKIAVIDGPVDTHHPCFEGASLEQVNVGVPTSCGVAGPESCSHGTHVASVLFAQHGRVDGLQGIAPRCKGVILPVFQDDPSVRGQILPASQSDLARAIEAAREHGARIINISGGQPSSQGRPEVRLTEAVRRCVEQGVLIVAAAGNEGCDCAHVPAMLPGVLAVGAVARNGEPAPFSNYGREYRREGLLAPGHMIPGAAPGGGVGYRSGTSFATPIVTGVAALLLSMKAPGNGAAGEVRKTLVSTAQPCPMDSPAACVRFLGGTLDVKKAFQSSLNGETAMNQQVSEVRGSNGAPEIPPDLASQEGAGVESSGCACGGGASNEAPPAAEPTRPVEEEEETPVRASVRSSSARPVFAPRPAPSRQGSAVRAAAVQPSCECEGAGPLVYALGEIGYDFGTMARQDSVFFAMEKGSPNVPEDLIAFLKKRPEYAPAVIWTLNLDGNPIYAIKPEGSYSREGYARLLEFYGDQIAEKTERVAIPGTIKGQVTLYTGQTVPVICPEYRGMVNWNTASLIDACQEAARKMRQAAKGKPGGKPDEDEDKKVTVQLENFLNRIYFEFRNMGVAAEERAINYAATNLFEVRQTIEGQTLRGYLLDEIEVIRSPICRRDSDCWDVKMVFFDTKNVLSPRFVARVGVDVSDVVPVLVGPAREWEIR